MLQSALLPHITVPYYCVSISPGAVGCKPRARHWASSTAQFSRNPTESSREVPQSKEYVGEDEWHWLADTVPISWVSVVDLEQGGAAGVPGPVLLFWQHSGLSWTGTAQCA